GGQKAKKSAPAGGQSSAGANETRPQPPALAPPSTSRASGSARLPQNRQRLGAPLLEPIATAPVPTLAPARFRPRGPTLEEAPFDPLGIHAGSFVLRPAIELTRAHDSNPSRAA